MNPLQLDQRTKNTSFRSRSIVDTTGALLLEYPSTLQLFRPRQASPTEEENQRPYTVHGSQLSSQDVVAISMKMAVIELEYFSGPYPSVPRITRTSSRAAETPPAATRIASAFPKLFNRELFYH
jgi:hypothetical protein